jgi:hypothetical protein
MTLMPRVQRGRTPKPPRLLVYGTEGIGKSTFAANAPKPVFVQTEDGLDEIACDKFPLATTYSDVIGALVDLRTQQHGFESVVIDSVDWLERLIWDHVCRESGAATIEKADGGYGRGYVHALTFWREVLDQLNILRAERSMVILLIAHAKIERFEDPETSPYDRYTPRLQKHASALVCEWCDAVLFATRKIRTQTEDAGFNRRRTIAHAIGKDGGERILRCVGGPSCIAKNRYGIVDDLPLSWAAFIAAMSTNQKEGLKTNG